eukprot:6197286-Pleurochrysis_carterae.AAC.1
MVHVDSKSASMYMSAGECKPKCKDMSMGEYGVWVDKTEHTCEAACARKRMCADKSGRTCGSGSVWKPAGENRLAEACTPGCWHKAAREGRQWDANKHALIGEPKHMYKQARMCESADVYWKACIVTRACKAVRARRWEDVYENGSTCGWAREHNSESVCRCKPTCESERASRCKPVNVHEVERAGGTARMHKLECGYMSASVR